MLKFICGTMGSSKTAHALITKYNYEQKDFKVFLLKPSTDVRDDKKDVSMIRSRIGLESPCIPFDKTVNLQVFITQLLFNIAPYDTLIIIDEVQFCSSEQIEQLKALSEVFNIFCYGLKTNFKSFLFEGSKRLLELADEVITLPQVCVCGRPATINARVNKDKIVVEGDEIKLGKEELYEAMCYFCWKKMLNEQKESLNNKVTGIVYKGIVGEFKDEDNENRDDKK